MFSGYFGGVLITFIYLLYRDHDKISKYTNQQKLKYIGICALSWISVAYYAFRLFQKYVLPAVTDYMKNMESKK